MKAVVEGKLAEDDGWDDIRASPADLGWDALSHDLVACEGVIRHDPSVVLPDERAGCAHGACLYGGVHKPSVEFGNAAVKPGEVMVRG